MTDQQAQQTATAICDLFEKIGPALKTALIQELERGNYDPTKVIQWANWRRVETTTFELTELRHEFRQEQPPKRPDGATSQWQRQRSDIEANYAIGQADRDRMKSFFENQDAESLALLKAEYIATCPENARPALESRDVRVSQLLRHGIWNMVKHQVA